MEYTTKLFGKIDVNEDKIIEFPEGILGFEELKKFTLMFDSESSSPTGLNFLVSLDEPAFMMPVVPAIAVKPDYSPSITGDIEKAIGPLTEDNLLIMVTMTIPSDITQMTVNLNAPIIINSESRKAIQSMVENEGYDIKYPIYESLKK
ncbi:MAG: flagellar assembly protein FliW [Lachnospiraceae bacterium]|nr:flagellar assembly protein FliW [Lachnospiraceae bacterium]MBP5745330.1 flagellar assembly protein FliW [Lachnospiraceae bacterium]